MKVPFIAAVLLTAVIYCSAADEECLYRKERNLPLQWASDKDCGIFYRCGPKDVVREVKCPAGKDFVERTGKCEKSGPRTCKLKIKQTPAADANPCEGVADGESVPDPTFCAQYYICDGTGTGILTSCPPGGLYNATRGLCVADPLSTCWQNKCIDKPNGEYIPDTDSCRTYYICDDNVAIRQTCVAGSYLAPDDTCRPDLNNQCFENYCIGQLDGVLVGNSENCNAYYKCENDIAVPELCPEDNYFDVGLGVCMLGNCPDITTTPASVETTTKPTNTEICCGQADGAVVADPDDCYAYYYCKDQLAENVPCEPGYYFDKVQMLCTLGVCPSDENCTCPGGYENGAMLQHPDSCILFYICDNGNMVERSCLPGNYWNPVAKECMLDTDGMCPESAPITTTTVATPVVAKLKKKLKPNAQRPKRSIEDIVDSLDEEDILQLTEPVAEEHAHEHEIEPTALIAKPAVKCLGIYDDGQFVAHPDDCRKFQICYDGELYEQSCGIGNYFNGALNTCVPDTQNLCPIKPIAAVDTTTGSNCTCPGGYAEGQFVPYPGNCSLFYICHETLLLEGSCGEGNLFDSATSACVPDVNNTCWPPTEPCNSTDICAGVPDNSALPVPNQCNAFFFCMDNVSTYYQCPDGDYFNANIGICLPDTQATCINPCVNTTGIITTLPHPDCSMYYLCNNGQTYVQNCTQGYYDVATGVCSTTAVCPTAFCQNQPEYTTFPVEGNTQEFYICIGGVAVLKQCLPGTAYNATAEVCLQAPSALCNQTLCPNNFEAFPTLDGQTDAFCFCKGNDAYLESCPTDYTFNETLGICYSNAPCDPMICTNSPDYTVSVNRNSSDSFCLCVYKQPVIVDCPAGTVFNQYQLLCLPPNAASSNCRPNSCVGAEQNSAIAPMPGLTGFCFCQNNEATYYACPQNSVFNPTIGICQSPLPVDQACNASLCATETVFPTVNDPYSFCYCLGNGTVILQRCSDGTQFDPEKQVCLQSPCNPDICIGQQNGQTFPANNYTYGFCECNNQLPQLIPCPANTIYSPERQICLPEVDLYCDVALCANATIENPYAVPAINNTNAFCYCSGPNNVMKLDCPSNTTFNATVGICVSEIQAGCTCPGGYADGSFVPHLTDCNSFFICVNGLLQEMDCGEGNFFNATEGTCQLDAANTCITAAQAQSTCVGAFKNGEFLPHPLSNRLYYICMDAQLHESDCGPGNRFDAILGHCTGPHSRKVQKRSAPVDELPCIDNSKRSVPANCSQYELCIDRTWRRRSCTNQRYYNPEQQLCLEPRDDLVCTYAKVTGLPACTNATELQTHPSKTNNCMQYFVCSHEKWRFKSCPNNQYYSRTLRTCITTADEHICANNTASSNTTTVVKQSSNCQHTAVRSYAHNCAMYLMCRENEWWYQHCPPGMYFNHTQNFCMPATDGECDDVVPLASGNDGNGTALANSKTMETELMILNCTMDGALRPSAYACDKYYMCVNGQWQALHCKPSQYFNVTAEACVADDSGICAELEAECMVNETREFPLNCTAYERCTAGKWQRFNCPKGYAYDLITAECIVNDGYCLPGGLRKACNAGETRQHPIAENCTQFYYCELDKWRVGSCLKGNTYDVGMARCVPHAINNTCLALTANAIKDQISDSQENLVCQGKADGVAVQHQDDCSRFHICMNGKPTKEMYCTTGSYFDPKLGYCLPNDGTCIIPLTGACANATDGSYVPHPLDCTAYYHCSTRNGTQLLHCPQGEYYHKFTHQCRIDHGQCHQPSAESKCTGYAHGTLLPHETYCNIYYACVRGLAIPVECPQENVFNDVLGHCVYDVAQQCENGHLNGNGMKYSCGNLTDGAYLPDRFDCTRFFICTGGEAIPQRCGAGAYFDSKELLCVEDDGSCPYVDDDQPNNQPVPPDPIVCEGKHGNMMPDPANCNEFYVCINGKLRHDRCYKDYFFNGTSFQCQAYQRNTPGDGETGNATTVVAVDVVKVAASRIGNASKQCTDKPTDYADLCQQIPEGTSIAEQGDCRRYVTCEDNGPVTLRCRNGESFDSLLGFCRQNDGTCLLENGERVGVCNKHHGQLVRDVDNCRGYFVCINGQRISGECAEDEYFSKSQNMCQKDRDGVCQKTNGEVSTVSCNGLSETGLYPHVQSQCRSYFQCVKGVPKIYECADGLYFNATTTRCVKEISECSMSTTTTTPTTLQRADLERKKPMNKCDNVVVNYPYADLEDKCRTFFVCQSDGTISYEKCPDGKLFSEERGVCIEAKLVRCQPGFNF